VRDGFADGGAVGGPLDILGKVFHLEHLAHLHDVALRRRNPLRPVQSLLPRGRLNHPESADDLLGLGERTVGHGGLAALEAYLRGLRGRRQTVQRQQRARLRKLLVEPHHLLDRVRRRSEVLARLRSCRALIDRRNHEQHEPHSIVSLSPFLRSPRGLYIH
jgi:hypothetical protein